MARTLKQYVPPAVPGQLAFVNEVAVFHAR